MTEEWRSVVGFEGRYEVSNMGRVKALGRIGAGKGSSATDRILRQQLDSRGNGRAKPGFRVNLVPRDGGRSKPHRVHRLVARAFLGDPPTILADAQVNHKDGDPQNNAAENLEWCTQSENIRHGLATGLYPEKTHCPAGHELTPENTWVEKGTTTRRGGRRCKTCRSQRRKQYYEDKEKPRA